MSEATTHGLHELVCLAVARLLSLALVVRIVGLALGALVVVVADVLLCAGRFAVPYGEPRARR